MSFANCAIRMTADISLALALPTLWIKFAKTGPDGIALSTQVMTFIVFVSRYIDLLTGHYVSPYNSFMKAFYILTSFITITVISLSVTQTNKRSSLNHVLLLSLPSLLLGTFVNYASTYTEIMWAFSMYLAAVAPIPQLIEFDRAEVKDPWMVTYLVLSFASRALYLPHWVLRYFDEHRLDPIAAGSGILQTLIYLVAGFVIVLHHSRRQAIQIDEETATTAEKEPIEKVAVVDLKEPVSA